MSLASEQVKQVSHRIINQLRSMTPEEVGIILAGMVDYHGFRKVRISPESLGIPGFPAVNPDKIQVEIVLVLDDLSGEIHHHEHAFAYVIVLGYAEHVHPPSLASAFLLPDGWRRIFAADEIQIPQGMSHGFTVQTGGTLYFLSVQSPPIVSADGHDDYHRG